MISLASYLETCVSDRSSAAHTADRGDFRLAQASLKAYVESRGGAIESTPLLDLALPGWLSGYFGYVVEEYESNKSRNRERPPRAERVQWARRYLKCVRKAVNRAIRCGYLPNIDYFAGIEDASDFARRQGVEEDAKASAQLLALSKTKIAYRPRSSALREPLPPTPDAAARSSALREPLPTSPDASAAAPELAFGAIDLYLLCLYCGGMELDEFYSLADSDIDPARPRIRLPWAGIGIELSQTVHSSLLAYRAMPQFGKRDGAVVARALEAAKSGLFRSQSVFIDWLRFAKDQGVPDSHIARLAEARRNPGSPLADDLRQSIQKVVYRMGAHYNKFKKQWYCIYTHRSTGEDKYNEMLRSERPPVPDMAGRRADFYFPNVSEIAVRKVQGQRIVDPRMVLKRYLFVCCSSFEIRSIDQHLSSISVLGRRKNGLKEYTIVPANEIYTLQLMLESIRGTDAELMLEDEDIRAAIDTTPLKEKERVKILTPSYQEYEAEVIKVKQNSYYSVQLSIIGKTFVLKNVPRALIKRIA